MSDTVFDAIVVGSGISGGWAAKELTERGLKVLLIERGRNVEHGVDYPTEGLAPWELENRGRMNRDVIEKDYPVQGTTWLSTDTAHFRVKDSDHPYSQDPEKDFLWLRGYHLGGRSLIWGKQCYRLSDLDFEANKKDGHGIDWPIRYKDIAPWYDHVERFAGISGRPEGLAHLPDGVFQPPMDFTCVEEVLKEKVEAHYEDRMVTIGRAAHLTEPTEEQMELGRGQCQSRNQCGRGCSFGAYFSSQAATLPAAERTGNLHKVTDAIGHSVVWDEASGKASGVRVIDAKTMEAKEYKGRIVFLCASAIGSTQILLNSISERFQNGIANGSGVLGHYLMDHIYMAGANGMMEGFEDKYYKGRRPNGIYVPRFRNVNSEHEGFLRGFGFQGYSGRVGWNRGQGGNGHGADFKNSLREPGPWYMGLAGFGEMLPYRDNTITLHPTKKDKWGIPLVHVSCDIRENEHKMRQDMADTAAEMLRVAGFKNVQGYVDPEYKPGQCIHEMGTARMGNDPSESVLNGWNQAHEVPNLFVTDGACMTSSACQNPSLTYMALTARAANYAADQLQAGVL